MANACGYSSHHQRDTEEEREGQASCAGKYLRKEMWSVRMSGVGNMDGVGWQSHTAGAYI